MRVRSDPCNVCRILLLPFLALSFLCCVVVACGDPSLKVFPRETTVEVAGVIEPAALGAPYAGGKIVDIAAGPGGTLLLATVDPGQVVEMAPDGRIVWGTDGSATRAGGFVGPGLSLSVGSGAIYLADSRTRRVHQLGENGELLQEVALDQAMEAAAARTGEIFVYPNLKGYLLDVFDGEFRYLQSILPLPGEPREVAISSCLLHPDPDGGVFALWNPTRTLYRLGPQGERRGEFSLDPPDLVANLDLRAQRARDDAARMGLSGMVNPFLDFTSDSEGRLALLYLFEHYRTSGPGADEERPEREAAAYRFTSSGEPVDVIRGLGAITRIAFAADGGIFGLEMEVNRLVRYRPR